MALPPFLTTEEVCQILGISRYTVFRRVQEGKWKSHRFGGRKHLFASQEIFAELPSIPLEELSVPKPLAGRSWKEVSQELPPPKPETRGRKPKSPKLDDFLE